MRIKKPHWIKHATLIKAIQEWRWVFGCIYIMQYKIYMIYFTMSYNHTKTTTQTTLLLLLPSRWQILLYQTAGKTHQRCGAPHNLCWMGWPAREKGHQRWSWAERRVTGLSRCSVHGRCCMGWQKLSRRSECSDPCCSGVPGLYTVTGDKMKGMGGEGSKDRGMSSVIIGEYQNACFNLTERKQTDILLCETWILKNNKCSLST